MNIYFKSVPFSKNDVTLALESGVDGIIVPSGKVEAVAALSRIPAIAEEDLPSMAMAAAKLLPPGAAQQSSTFQPGCS